MGDLSDFEIGQIVGERLAGAFVTKTAILLGISRVAVYKVMSAYMNYGKTTSMKNSGRKSALTGRGRRTTGRIVSKNHRTTAAQVTGELNTYSSCRPCFHINCVM
jgi:hypothetical protein